MSDLLLCFGTVLVLFGAVLLVARWYRWDKEKDGGS